MRGPVGGHPLSAMARGVGHCSELLETGPAGLRAPSERQGVHTASASAVGVLRSWSLCFPRPLAVDVRAATSGRAEKASVCAAWLGQRRENALTPGFLSFLGQSGEFPQEQ